MLRREECRNALFFKSVWSDREKAFKIKLLTGQAAEMGEGAVQQGRTEVSLGLPLKPA